jgi:hypothetical protein
LALPQTIISESAATLSAIAGFQLGKPARRWRKNMSFILASRRKGRLAERRAASAEASMPVAAESGFHQSRRSRQALAFTRKRSGAGLHAAPDDVHTENVLQLYVTGRFTPRRGIKAAFI